MIGIARIAGIQGAKRTSELIPLCHLVALTRVAIDFAIDEKNSLALHGHCGDRRPTGGEMEVLTAVQMALLTIYGMCKAEDRGMTITVVRLLEKMGGTSDACLGSRSRKDKNAPQGAFS